MRLRIILIPALLGVVMTLTACSDNKDVTVPDSGSSASTNSGSGSSAAGGDANSGGAAGSDSGNTSDGGAGSSGGGGGDGSGNGNANAGNGGGSSNTGGSGSGDNGGSGTAQRVEPRTRYAFNDRCVVLRSNANGQYVQSDGSGGYTAQGDSTKNGEPFYMKPSALGKYLFYNSDRQLLANGGQGIGNISLANANDSAEFTLKGVGDDTDYPATPPVYTQPTVAYLDHYRSFQDPNTKYRKFNIFTGDNGDALTANDAGSLSVGEPGQGFTLVPASGCAQFPEAENNTKGDTFKGTKADGSVLGMADVHVHISATNFLGGAEWGNPFDKFGVTHALGDGSKAHGPQGTEDVLGAFYVGDFNGHDTTGWPTFPDWPAYDSLTHEAIYWKWLERGWKAGLRIAVNDLVENQTLCELTRNVNEKNPAQDCNSMDNARKQIGTMYAMQDYIDAQKGGRGAGWFRIVLDPQQARKVVEDGKLAVVLGIEISNLFNCKINYQPGHLTPGLTQKQAEQFNNYGCTKKEDGSPNSILFQLTQLHDLGVRQMITVHEFDNAFGGNGIFNNLILNLGNRENSGGIPSGYLANAAGLVNSVNALRDPSSNDQTGTLGLNADQKNQLGELVKKLGPTQTETPTGEFWTTYDCPSKGDTSQVDSDSAKFSGYLFDDAGGSQLQSVPGGACTYMGQGGRPGGPTPCYPKANQCNARWLTPIGLYTYQKIMQAGLMFDFDHNELEIKSQILDLAEAQDPTYPIISTHGTFGGTSIDQAKRVIRDGGFIYPGLGNGHKHIRKMTEMRKVYNEAVADMANKPLFAFGFGTDTNGLSKQAKPRKNIADGEHVTYPYTLFSGPIFNKLKEFNNIDGVVFKQPKIITPDGKVTRTWSLDKDGSAQYGMLSGMVEEMVKEGTPQDMRNLYDSAERYLRTWKRTLAASAAINANGINTPNSILREAPKPDNPAPIANQGAGTSGGSGTSAPGLGDIIPGAG